MVTQINNIQNANGAAACAQNQYALEMNAKSEYVPPVEEKEAASENTNSYLQEYLKDRIHIPDTRERVAVEVPARSLEEAQALAQVISGKAVASVAAAMNKLRAEDIAGLVV